MSEAADLFPGFASHHLELGEAKIFARVGGSGPPLLLLHGYPQSHLMWHRVAVPLASHFTLVAADLRGYGQSSCPPTDMQHRPYSKRVMAAEMAALMAQLGFARFRVMGHDRGARVAYRMALDRPDVVERLVLLDIISTLDQWQAHSRSARLRTFHWPFLAQPAPLPESLIAKAPFDWVDSPFKRGTRDRGLAAIDARTLAAYRNTFLDADRIHASCEDYRAGATCDLEDDEADRVAGRRIACPTLVVWGTHGTPVDFADPLGLWQHWCVDVRGVRLDSGHFIAEECPDGLLEQALPFLMQRGEPDR